MVDDERDVCNIVRRWLRKAGYEVEVFHDGQACLAGLSRTRPDAIYLDLDMPGLSGLEVLERIKSNNRLLPVIILTGDTKVETVVSAMQLGAYDYLVKPMEGSKILITTKNAVERYQMSVRLAELERKVEGRGYPEITGSSPPMKELFRKMDQVAASDITVLLHGESGTGKELVAQAIHAHSGRKNGPFVALNCAAIPETLQESELFGHEKGAFTGATDRRPGRFEQAHRGTLLLDEVAELSPTLQAKLLRAVQGQCFQRVGGSAEIHSNFRLIAATHRNLTDKVKAGAFREDLFFRIAVFELDLPPLRARKEDIPLLAQKFLREFSQKKAGRKVTLSPEAVELLMSYSWPGNVRELQNVIQRALVISGADVILPHDLPSRLRTHVKACYASGVDEIDNNTVALTETSSATEPSSLSIDRARTTQDNGFPTLNLEEIERRVIEQALKDSGGNRSKVVRVLGIGRTTLYRKLKRYKLR